MLDGYLFAVGGWEGRSRLASVECYNPHTNAWQFMQPVKMAVTSPAVVALDGHLYVTGTKRMAHGRGLPSGPEILKLTMWLCFRNLN